ncbi:MAG TPA: hypothetical protein VKN99_11600 [Polyangia bacterium]|nr:hypothetical protein [Polyangia bacterium]
MAEEEPEQARARLRNVGGTKGGLAEFLIGLALLTGGGYLFLDNVLVTGNVWSGFFGVSSFGLTLIPIFIGIAILFFNGKSVLGWLLTGGGAVAIFVGVLARMNIWFKPTSLFNTLLMLGLMAGGIGLIARALRPH